MAQIGRFLNFSRFRHLLALACLAASSSYAINTMTIDRLANAHPKTHTGVLIFDAQDGSTLYESHSFEQFAPASIQKLLTATAATIELGPNFHYITKLSYTGNIHNNTLYGDLILRFSGDPTLTQSDVKKLFIQLKDSGINQIQGNVKIDTLSYDNVFYPSGWSWDDLTRSFAAPLSSVIINKNRFAIIVKPGKAGQTAYVTHSLPPGAVRIYNNMKTSTSTRACPFHIYSDIHNTYQVQGCISQRYKAIGDAVAVRNPLIYAQALVRQDLYDVGIECSGSIGLLNRPLSGTAIATHESKPLPDILKIMLKKSDNLYADTLLKTVGSHYYKTQGTWQNGLSAVRALLEKNAGVTFENSAISDGAGLSSYNLLSPQQFKKVLVFVYQNNSVRNMMLPALPISGKDGTLANRMGMPSQRGRVVAKTGTMKGVSTLAGYVFPAHHRPMGFVFMMNGFVGSYGPPHQIQDALCTTLLTQ